jgi:hypothetical protein
MFFVYGRKLSVVYPHGSWGYCRYGLKHCRVTFKARNKAESSSRIEITLISVESENASQDEISAGSL